MITIPTVLILGAGASSHIGYPVGDGFIKDIIDVPINRLMDSMYTVEQIKDFRLRLSRYASYSIDEFLEKNRELEDIGKSFIAHSLKTYEMEDKLFPPYDSGWYQYLFNSMLTSSVEDLVNNKITIITFNYDRSLEAYLHNTIMYRFKISKNESAEILKKIKIIHMHGILGEYPDVPYSQNLEPGFDDLDLAAKFFRKITGSIKIIYEIKDNADTFCSIEFEEANKALQESEKIYFLGFGFHEDNIRRFRFFSEDSLKGKEVKSTFSGIANRELYRILKMLSAYGIGNIFHSSTCICSSFFREIGSLE